MAQARGADTTIALFEESTYNTTPGTPDGQRLYITSSSLSRTQNRIDSNTLSADRSRTTPAAGNISVGGPINMELHAESMGTLLKHTLGANATTGVDPYVHTMTIGDLPVGLEIEHDYGGEITGSGRYELFTGVRVAGATFTFPAEGYCTASFDFMGATSALGSSPTDATLTDNGRTPFSAFQASITEGGVAIAYVQSAEIRLDNGLDGSSYVIGGAGIRREIPEGFATITGTITALFESAALLTKAVDGTSSSLKITLSRGDGLGSAGNESMSFEVQHLKFEPASVPIEGPAGLVLTLPFKGSKSGTDLGLEVIVKNAVATI